MRVAVLSLCRDRLDYTKHCFAALRENAGCEFDHYVLDQGSSDATDAWLMDEYDYLYHYTPLTHNIGISAALNYLLMALEQDERAPYDVIVKFDNDCLVEQPDTLRIVAETALEGNCLLSPRILGLQNPPPIRGEFTIGTETILDVPQIGGIFLAAPASVYDTFRYSESNPVWGHDDVEICHWFRRRGGRCGYVKRLEAWHYQTTDGQQARYPGYFARKRVEMGG